MDLNHDPVSREAFLADQEQFGVLQGARPGPNSTTSILGYQLTAPHWGQVLFPWDVNTSTQPPAKFLTPSRPHAAPTTRASAPLGPTGLLEAELQPPCPLRTHTTAQDKC